MDIVNNRDIQQKKETLRLKFASLSKSGEFIKHYLDVKGSVDHWDWATHGMFSIIPFEHELNKFRKGRRLNLSGLEEAFEENAFAFGFSKDGRLLLTAWPYAPGAQTGVQCSSHFYSELANSKARVDYENSVQYPLSKFKPMLVGLGTLTWLNDETQLDIGVGDRDAYSATVYSYSADRVVKAERFAQGWNGQTRYDFIYDDEGKLDRIMIGSHVWWSAKKGKRPFNSQTDE
jgi:hypothetical protein